MAAEAERTRKLDFEEIQIPPGPRLGSVVIEAKTGYPQKVALSNSLGFGGHNASLAVSPYRA